MKIKYIILCEKKCLNVFTVMFLFLFCFILLSHQDCFLQLSSFPPGLAFFHKCPWLHGKSLLFGPSILFTRGSLTSVFWEISRGCFLPCQFCSSQGVIKPLIPLPVGFPGSPSCFTGASLNVSVLSSQLFEGDHRYLHLNCHIIFSWLCW